MSDKKSFRFRQTWNTTLQRWRLIRTLLWMSQSADLSKNIAIVPKELSIYVQGTCNIIHVKAPFVYQASRNVYYKHIILFCECKCQRVKTYCFNIKKNNSKTCSSRFGLHQQKMPFQSIFCAWWSLLTFLVCWIGRVWQIFSNETGLYLRRLLISFPNNIIMLESRSIFLKAFLNPSYIISS